MFGIAIDRINCDYNLTYVAVQVGGALAGLTGVVGAAVPGVTAAHIIVTIVLILAELV